MSPPQHPVKTNPTDYTYKPRSQTPDRMGYPGQYSGVTRPYRSSSGTMMQRPSPFEEVNGSQSARPPFARLNDHMPLAQDPRYMDQKPSAEHSQRSSISAILGPQDAAPQSVQQTSIPPSSVPFERYGRTEPGRPGASRNGFYTIQQTTNGPMPGMQSTSNTLQQNGNPNSYDTRPPNFGAPPVQATSAPRPMDDPTGYGGRPQAQSESPESRRRMLFANITGHNGNTQHLPYTQEQPSIGSQIMARQDSSRSQNDPFGDRNRRRFSPFATSATSQPFPSTSAPPEDRNRKGSDESSQHKAILGLAAESKRGRYSPLPQAVHGAQAQTPTPDAGIKDEHGRVFSGLGSGIMSNASTVTPGPPGLSASPFKRDEGVARLSEDNLMKISRSTPGISKRPRKMKDEEDNQEDRRRVSTNGRGKRSKYSHYNLNGEELTNALAYPRKTTPSTLDFSRRTATPTTYTSLNRNAATTSVPAPTPPPTLFKPRTTLKINSVIREAARKPRKHLGFFLYNPKITPQDNTSIVAPRREIQIEPNIHPAFDVPEHTNCTYTIRVSRTWLRKAEREAICTTRAVWGSGIYTDDTDPIAAAIHSGFIKASYGDHVDQDLLEKAYSTQNPKIDGGSEHLPKSPVEPPVGKDCQITLVVLPPLDTYNSCVRYGLKSRRWPEEKGEAPHDGVSFMVLNTRWVDERSQRGKGRRGEVVRKRTTEV
jgi:Histone deacetylation protein Rxt3